MASLKSSRHVLCSLFHISPYFGSPACFLNCYSLHSHLSLNSVILYFLGHYFPSRFFIRCLSSDPCLSSILRKKEKKKLGQMCSSPQGQQDSAGPDVQSGPPSIHPPHTHTPQRATPGRQQISQGSLTDRDLGTLAGYALAIRPKVDLPLLSA